MMKTGDLLAARSVLCRAMWRKRLLPCKNCPLERLREPGTSCRDSVLKHKSEAEEILKTK